MAWNLYDNTRLGQYEGNTLNYETLTTIKAAIVTSVYSVDQNTHDFFDDITNEVTGTNYTAGGNVVANMTVTMNASGLVTIDGDDPTTWAQHASGFSNGRRAILYNDTGTASTSRLIAFSDDFGADKGNVSGDFSIQLDAAGIFDSPR